MHIDLDRATAEELDEARKLLKAAKVFAECRNGHAIGWLTGPRAADADRPGRANGRQVRQLRHHVGCGGRADGRTASARGTHPRCHR